MIDAHSNTLHEYTKDQVKCHNHENNTWIIIHRKVFDITDYLENHPGGVDILAGVAGTDATAAYEDVGHSDDAAEIMQSYLIGTLKGPSDVRRPSAVQLIAGDSSENASSSGPSNFRAVTMTLGISATFCVYLHSTNVVGDKSVGSQSTQKALLPSGGFISGFITATAVYVVFSSLMIYYVARRLTRVKSGFAHNPAYIKVGHEVRSGE